MLWINCEGCGYPTAHFDSHGRPTRLFFDSFGRELCGTCFGRL